MSVPNSQLSGIAWILVYGFDTIPLVVKFVDNEDAVRSWVMILKESAALKTMVYNIGKSYTKTGKPGGNGIYARRLELPAPLNAIERDRLVRCYCIMERLSGEGGFLIVPYS